MTTEIAVLQPEKYKQLQYLLAAAMIPGAFAAVILYAGEPSGIEGSTPYLVAVTGVLLVATLAFYLRSRVQVRLVQKPDGVDAVLITGGARADEFRMPVRCYKCFTWNLVMVGTKLKRVPELVLAILDPNGVSQVAFREQLGALHSPPEGWPEDDVAAPTTYHLGPGAGVTRLDKFCEALATAGATWESPRRPTEEPASHQRSA
jgi:hypothetical protein